MTCSVCWRPDTRQCLFCSQAFCDMHYNPFCEQCSPDTAGGSAAELRGFGSSEDVSRGAARMLMSGEAREYGVPAPSVMPLISEQSLGSRPSHEEAFVNCYICDGVAIGQCPMCTRRYCGSPIEGGLCKPCEILFLNSISGLDTGESQGAEGMHERMLKAAEPNGIHREHVPTLEQLQAFGARAAAWQREHLNLQVQRAATDAAMTQVAKTNLQRVVPVGQTKTLRGGEMTLLSLELYDDGLILHWWLRAPTGHEPFTEDMFRAGSQPEPAEIARYMQSVMKQLVVTAKDDLGNAYRGGMGVVSWRESNVDCRSHARLTPAVDPRALRLRVRIEEMVTHQVHGQPAILMNADGSPFPSSEPPEIGPWEFEVALN